MSSLLRNSYNGKRVSKIGAVEKTTGALNGVMAPIMAKGNTVDEKLRSLAEHPLYGDPNDRRLYDHVTREYQRAYPGAAKFDEFGKMQRPKSGLHPDKVQNFDPDKQLLLMKAAAKPTAPSNAQNRQRMQDNHPPVKAEAPSWSQRVAIAAEDGNDEAEGNVAGEYGLGDLKPHFLAKAEKVFGEGERDRKERSAAEEDFAAHVKSGLYNESEADIQRTIDLVNLTRETDPALVESLPFDLEASVEAYNMSIERGRPLKEAKDVALHVAAFWNVKNRMQHSLNTTADDIGRGWGVLTGDAVDGEKARKIEQDDYERSVPKNLRKVQEIENIGLASDFGVSLATEAFLPLAALNGVGEMSKFAAEHGAPAWGQRLAGVGGGIANVLTLGLASKLVSKFGDKAVTMAGKAMPQYRFLDAAVDTGIKNTAKGAVDNIWGVRPMD